MMGKKIICLRNGHCLLVYVVLPLRPHLRAIVSVFLDKERSKMPGLIAIVQLVRSSLFFISSEIFVKLYIGKFSLLPIFIMVTMTL